MMKPIEIAFIGGGLNSAVGQTHRIAIEMDQRFRLVAGCFSHDSEINKQTGERYQIAPQRTYQNLEEMITAEKGKIDAMVILTPTPDHLAMIELCLENRIPVICEKAMVANVVDAKKVEEKVKKTKGFLAVTYNYTGYPMVRELKQLIEDGKLGKVLHVQIEMPQEGFIRVHENGEPVIPQGWRLSDGDIPTISLDLGVHLLNMIHFLTAEKPESIVANQTTFGSFSQIVDDVCCIARYSNGLVCNIWYGKCASGHRNGLKVRVFGEKGGAEWYQDEPERLRIADHKGRIEILDRASPSIIIADADRYSRFKAGHPAGFIEAFANYYGDIADVLESYLQTGKYKANRYVFGAKEALADLRVLKAIDRSFHENAWVKFL